DGRTVRTGSVTIPRRSRDTLRRRTRTENAQVKVRVGQDVERGVTAAAGGDDHPWVSSRATAGLAWLLCAASLTLAVLALVLESLNGPPISDSMVVEIVLLAITFPLVGAVVAARRPGNP